MVEREVVRSFIYPVFVTPPMSTQLQDQYAFRPTGSTTAALISILHHVTALLEDNPYVSIVSLDFSKAFDSVRHYTLAEKLSKLELPDAIYNWLINFLSERRHTTKFAGFTSRTAYINSSVVQGSGVGPSSYVVTASDLRPVLTENKIVKYADDTYLLVGAKKRLTITAELAQIAEWAQRNNLQLNPTKSREMLVTRSRIQYTPDLISGVQRVNAMKILGVTFRSDLRASGHVDEVLEACSRSLYALRVLRTHGLPADALHVVTKATTVARLMYAAPAWWGSTTEGDRSRLDRFLRRIQRMGFLPDASPSAADMVEESDERLLRAVIWNSCHVLRDQFPQMTSTVYNLRPRRHNFQLPHKDNINFISRVLYKNAYNH